MEPSTSAALEPSGVRKVAVPVGRVGQSNDCVQNVLSSMATVSLARFAWTRTAADIASQSSIFIQIASCVYFQHRIGIYWLRAASRPSMRTSARVDGVWGSFLHLELLDASVSYCR